MREKLHKHTWEGPNCIGIKIEKLRKKRTVDKKTDSGSDRP